jgi:triphosphatase
MARALPKPAEDAAPTELEVKLRLPPGAEAALEGHPALRPPGAAAPELREETTTYFDTPGRDLSRAGASLRIRRGGGRRVQTLKLRGGADGPFGRGEWEWPVEGDAPDLARLAEAPAVAPPGALRQLAPVFATEVGRRVRLLPLDGALVELSLDTGTLRAGEGTAEIRELELELKGGAPGPMYRLAAALQAEVPLTLGVESKAERGWRLCTGEPRAPRRRAGWRPPASTCCAARPRRSAPPRTAASPRSSRRRPSPSPCSAWRPGPRTRP